MSWVDFYLVCLIVGLALASLSLLLGAFHLHLPRFGGHSGVHLFASGHGHAGLLAPKHIAHAHADNGHVSAANFSNLMVFLAWFGGAGTLLAGTLHLGPWLALPGAVASGLFGGYLVYLFVARFLMAADHSMRSQEYALPGTLATLTLAIRAEGGTGEIAYVQGGTRKSAAARAEEPHALALGTEVVVTRFEEGIAYVRPFDGERSPTA